MRLRSFWIVICILMLGAFLHTETIRANLPQSDLDNYRMRFGYKVKALNTNLPDKSLFKQGLILLNYSHDYLSAELIFRYLAEKHPSNPEYLYYQSRASFFVGQYNYFPNSKLPYEISLKYINKALEFDNHNGKYLLMKAYALGQVGLVIKANEGGFFSSLKYLQAANLVLDMIIGKTDVADQPEPFIKSVIEKGGPYVEAVLTRGEIYHGAPSALGGSPAKALKLYNYVAARWKNNPRVYYLMGKYYSSQRQHAIALSKYQEARKVILSGLAPKTPETQYFYAFVPRNMGKALWSLKRKKQACTEFSKHISRRFTSSDGYKWVAYCHLKKGQKDKAIKLLKLSLYYDKHNKGAKNRLSLLAKKH
ncbi:MAG: hypothetical protein OEZ36_00670 [Spirochaetota bacterium]|nr:hypothetical protein [Spirochaetota bacterium]